MEINIEDYLDRDELVKIAREAAKERIEYGINHISIETLISLIGHAEIKKMVDEKIPNFKDQISNKIQECINNLSEYSVFSKGSEEFHSEPTAGYKLLVQSVEDKKDLIDKKVEGFIGNLTTYNIKEALENACMDAISEVFDRNNKNEEE